MQESEHDFQSVVSQFQVGLLATLAAFFGRSDISFSTEVAYRLDFLSDGFILRTGPQAAKMPFQLSIMMKTDYFFIDIYTDGADAYEGKDWANHPNQWQVRYEAPAFSSLDDLGQCFLLEIEQRLEQLKRLHAMS